MSFKEGIEDINPKDGFRNLYFDRERKKYIQFKLDQKTTCKIIFEQYKNDIIKQIEKLNDKMNIDEFTFYLVDLKLNKIDHGPSLIDLKLKWDKKIYNFLQNPQLMLCFLPINKSKNIELRKKARQEVCLKNILLEDKEEGNYDIIQAKEYFTNKTVYIFDKAQKIFNKGKGSIDTKKITININKKKLEVIEIPIINIYNVRFYYDSSTEKMIVPVKGEKPKYYIEIILESITYTLGFKDSSYKLWEAAIKTVFIKYKNLMVNKDFDNILSSSNNEIFSNNQTLMEKCFSAKDILNNDIKRRMFFDIFPNKNIAYIIDNISKYKLFILQEKYLEAWMELKQVISYIDLFNEKKTEENVNEDNEENKINHLIREVTERRITVYKSISDKVDKALEEINLTVSQDDFQKEIGKGIKDILSDKLFDDLFFYLYNLSILPFFEDIKKNLKKGSSPQDKPIIRQKFQLLLAIYFFQLFNMSSNTFNIIKMNSNENPTNLRSSSSSNISRSSGK